MNDLTIVSVEYYDKLFIMLNVNIAGDTNGYVPKWVIVSNTPSPDNEDPSWRLPNEQHEAITIVPGPGEQMRGSLHHAMGIQKGMGYANTRYILVLDPDFYIIRDNWIEDVIQHMQENELAFFGCPWHPKWANKWRYFPAPACMFIDTHSVGLVDFLPGLNVIIPDWRWEVNPPLWRRLLKTTKFRFQHMGKSPDTGWMVYQRNKHLSYDFALPVYDPEVYYPRGFRHVWLAKLMDKFMPDKWSYTPRKGSYTMDEYFTNTKWEQYYWKGEPFAYHLRNWMTGTEANIKRMVEMGILRESSSGGNNENKTE